MTAPEAQDLKPDSRGDIWIQEAAWLRARYSDEFVTYLRLTLPPAPGHDAEIAAARQVLWQTPIVGVILAQQLPDGSWPLGGPPWFRLYPAPLRVLVDYGMRDHPAVVRGLDYLLSTYDSGRFGWPRHDPHDPKEFYIAHQGRCLQVLAKAGLMNDPRAQEVAHSLLARQHGDGGWSIKPAWLYRAGEERREPFPSCSICTMEVMRGLSPLLGRDDDVVARILRFWGVHIDAADPALLLAVLEFCAAVGLAAGDSRVNRLMTLLAGTRGLDGRFRDRPEYFEVVASQTTWALGANAPRST